MLYSFLIGTLEKVHLISENALDRFVDLDLWRYKIAGHHPTSVNSMYLAGDLNRIHRGLRLMEYILPSLKVLRVQRRA